MIDEVTPLIEVVELAYKSPDEVADRIGAAREITPITNTPAQMPGEFRNYTLRDGSDLMIRFYEGRAVKFTLYFDQSGNDGVASPEEAVAYFGINVDRLFPDGRAVAGAWWKGSIGKIEFNRVGSTKTSIHTPKWGCVQAELRGYPS